MKKVILILIISLTSYIGISQNKDSLEIQKPQIAIFDSIEKVNYKLDSLSLNLEREKKELKTNIENASKTIDYQNSLINSFSNIITILAIFLTLITIIIPILTYLLGIRPSQKALKELQSNMNSVLGGYLRDSRNKQIENALENIKNGNTEQKNQAVSFLALTQHEGFTDEQLFEIYNILEDYRDENNIKSQLSFILSSRKNKYADKLFNGQEIIDDPVLKQMAYLYYSKIGYKKNYKGIKIILESTDNQISDFTIIAYNIMQYSKDDLETFFNDSQILENISESTFSLMKEQMPLILKQFNIDLDIYKKSLLYTKVNKKHTA